MSDQKTMKTPTELWADGQTGEAFEAAIKLVDERTKERDEARELHYNAIALLNAADLERAKLNPDRQSALAAVMIERDRQDKKWGEQNHDPLTWSVILTEECGEFAEAALHLKFGGHAAAGLRDEAIHCAAVALQIVECLDRNTAKRST